MQNELVSSLETPKEVDPNEDPIKELLAMVGKGLLTILTVAGFLVGGMLYFIFYIVFAGLGEKGYR